MRLIAKTILYYLIVSIPLMIIAGLVGYSLIKKEIQDSTDEYLWKEKLNSEKIIHLHKPSSVFYLSTDSLSKITPIIFNGSGYTFSDTAIYDSFEEELLNYRLLKHYSKLNGQNYLITVAKSTMEDDDLKESLLKAFSLIIGLLVIAFFVLSWLLSKTLWKPFYKSIDQLNDYDIRKHTQLQFDKATVKEFEQLNLALNRMTDKIYSDYVQQKEFTENASHEMQTPLAVIKANLNLLMQSPNLKEEEMNQIQIIENTVRKLTSLNKALLLLSKIENDQFLEKTSVHLNEIISKTLENYQELIAAKSLEVKTEFKDDVFVSMNMTLADVLIGNLIQNAIRHNTQNGKIKVTLNADSLSISNTGESLNIDPNDLFSRFKKNNASKDSIGLGLSIVKSIGKYYGFNIDYQYMLGNHIFQIKFR